MEDVFKIYIDRLKNGQNDEIDTSVSPEFMEINEKELIFKDPVQVSGKAYLADEHLVLHLNIETVARMPCKMCNELVTIPISIAGDYQFVPLQEVKGGVYDITSDIREAVLLELPSFAECPEGTCEGRSIAHEFMNSNGAKDDHTYHPFADLDGE